MKKPVARPIHRGAARLFLGKMYYTLRRYALWLSGRYDFVRRGSGPALPNVVFSHSTPLLRKLKDVDMVLQYNKIENLNIAVPRINGVTLYPGQTLSYWRLIGRPTRRKGYKAGMILKNGGFTAGTGGGLCQLSNLIYWLTLHTPLTVVERHRHSYDVFPDANRTQPFGSGATCFYNYGDLMIKNETEAVFQLQVAVTGRDLTGAWLCDRPAEYRYEVYERAHRMQSEFWGGFSRHNLIFRRKYDLDGVLIEDEYVTENHALMMYTPFLEQGRPNGER